MQANLQILHLETMPAECFEGGTGDLVIVQEYTTIGGETYVRLRIPMSGAVTLANDILAVVAQAARSAE